MAAATLSYDGTARKMRYTGAMMATPADAEYSSDADGTFTPALEQKVDGAVEGLIGALLTGWAVARGEARPCEIEVFDDEGKLVATAVADQVRRDLVGLDDGRTTVGFRVAVADLGRAGAVHVKADGVVLAGSPLATGAGHWDGAVSVHNGWAEGWLNERRPGFAAPHVRLLDQDGACLGEEDAAVGDAQAWFSPARFRIPLPPAAYRGELALHLVVDDAVVAITHTRLELIHHLDVLDTSRCCGWLFCPQAPSARFTIEAFRDGSRIGHGDADQRRTDVRDVYPEAELPGFEFLLDPLSPGNTGPCVVSLRVAGRDGDLFDGPYVIGKRRDFVPAARRAGALAQTLPLDPLAASVLQAAIASHLAMLRMAPEAVELRKAAPEQQISGRRFCIIVPIYRDVAVTAACIDSVLEHRNAAVETLVLVNDASPDAGMAALLDGYSGEPNLHVLTNADNLGFVRSVNRGLGFCADGDVILLNSDTRVFAGGLREMWRAAHSVSGIGTVTALSNNATIFSYPIPDQGCEALDDIDWETVAAAALAGGEGQVHDVPTGHGFCMLVTRALLDRVRGFDEGFGRGYGEENDLCLRGADLGFRNVVASGAFVEHRESVSFSSEKAALLQTNLRLLEGRYPEYAEDIRASLRRDDVRAARWAIDAHRLARSREEARFTLVLRNWLEGGTRQAIVDIEMHLGEASSQRLDLCVYEDGTMRLTCGEPRLVSVFAGNEYDALFALLDHVTVSDVQVHQLLGFSAGFVSALQTWGPAHRLRFYLHDFYPLCPRVTMLDALHRFCDVAPIEVCARCVELGGGHHASRMKGLSPAEHRALFDGFLGSAAEVIAPSPSAALYLSRAFPQLRISVVPHPEDPSAYQVPIRSGSLNNIVLLGAIGPHKGSAQLHAIAQYARLTAPDLQFHVIGYTDCDDALRKLGNVQISGPYRPFELASLVAETEARLALFLQAWPETFSYTLSEAVQLGLVPLVPDIGAPAERVRAAGFGHVFGFPVDPSAVVALLSVLASGEMAIAAEGATPACFARP
jgi:GT2 family glycosyltransferase